MDRATETESTTTSRPPRQRAKKAAAAPPGPAVQLKQLRERWYPAAQAWIAGRTVRWPDDLVELVRAAGVPCSDCLEIVRRVGDGRHGVTYAQGSPEHWASGIAAHCGVTRAV